MIDAFQTGYCTNVHAGTDLATAQSNLEKYAGRVRDQLSSTAPLGIGLWLAAPAAMETLEAGRIEKFRHWLNERRLIPFTMNGFPYGNFHDKIVKHQVYLPTWWEPERLSYTQQLVQILDALLPPGKTGSISTLPIGWPSAQVSDSHMLAAAKQFEQVAKQLDQLWNETGREIVLAVEPEPGCILGDSKALRAFFDRYLLNSQYADRNRRFLTVCYDICHAAVMRENQAHELQEYANLGMRIGKVQVSSAVYVDWDKLTPAERESAYQQLTAFAEDRYLHQTTVADAKNGDYRLVEDLPELLRSVADSRAITGSWCIHFHVPVYVDSFGVLGTTQPLISELLDELSRLTQSASDSQFFTGHFEVETYAWGVLPAGLAESDLATGIAREMKWFEQLIRGR